MSLSWLLVVASSPWLINTSLQFLPPSSHDLAYVSVTLHGCLPSGVRVCVCVCVSVSLLVSALVVLAEGPTLLQHGLGLTD